MEKRAPVKVALVYDRADWVLGEIAAHVRRNLNARSTRLRVDTYCPPGDAAELDRIEQNCDVIHFLSPWNFYDWHGVVARPCVVTVHHLVTYDRFARSQHRADAVCVPHASWRDSLLGMDPALGERLHVTPYGIDCTFFRPHPGAREALVTRLGCPGDALLLGFSAKKSSNEGGRKGLDRYWKLLEGVLATSHRPVFLLISGPDWLPSDVPAGVRDNVRLMGYLRAEERPAYFSGLDYYVCLSRVEGGPYPVLECMACGVKTISTPVGVVPTLVVDEVNGFIVTAENYLERIPAILATWSEEDQRTRNLRVEARRSVLESYDWGVAVDPARYEGLYTSAVATWTRRPAKRIMTVAEWEQQGGGGGWRRRLNRAAEDLRSHIPPGGTFILVDGDQCRADLLTRGKPIPFLERAGTYWGPPPDDQTAIAECERLRRSGASYLVVLWPAFWWLDYYAGLNQYLRSRFPSLVENDRAVVFDLRPQPPSGCP